MIWSRTILDGIVVCLIFNVTVAHLWMMIPNAFSKMLPAEIRKASPKREKKEVIILEFVLDGLCGNGFYKFWRFNYSKENCYEIAKVLAKSIMFLGGIRCVK